MGGAGRGGVVSEEEQLRRAIQESCAGMGEFGGAGDGDADLERVIAASRAEAFGDARGGGMRAVQERRGGGFMVVAQEGEESEEGEGGGAGEIGIWRGSLRKAGGKQQRLSRGVWIGKSALRLRGAEGRRRLRRRPAWRGKCRGSRRRL